MELTGALFKDQFFVDILTKDDTITVPEPVTVPKPKENFMLLSL